MFYAEFVYDESNTHCVGGLDGKPQNFVFRGFNTRAERDERVNEVNSEGRFRKIFARSVHRSEVEQWHGKRFQVVGADNECVDRAYAER